MKANILICAVISVLAMVSGVFARPASQDPLDPKALSLLQTALMQDGLDACRYR